jgi:hypothetical protein
MITRIRRALAAICPCGGQHQHPTPAQAAARARYTAEARALAERAILQARADALTALCHRAADRSLTWHDTAVARGLCTVDCPQALEWQMELQSDAIKAA